MAGSGSTILDLGAFPGVSDAEFTITGITGIADTSKVEAWILPADTADHLLDEHVVDPPDIKAYSPSASGTSMKVRLIARNYPNMRDTESAPIGPADPGVTRTSPRIYGKWNVGYAWA